MVVDTMSHEEIYANTQKDKQWVKAMQYSRPTTEH